MGIVNIPARKFATIKLITTRTPIAWRAGLTDAGPACGLSCAGRFRQTQGWPVECGGGCCSVSPVAA
jgi:hypothetical protein